MKQRQSSRLAQEDASASTVAPSAPKVQSDPTDTDEATMRDVMVDESAQDSLLDSRQSAMQTSLYRGFFHLAWICMMVGCAGAIAKTYRTQGYFFGMNLYHAFTADICMKILFLF